MKTDDYYHIGLRIIVAAAVLLVLVGTSMAMISRGFSLGMTLLLLIPVGLLLVGLCFVSYGSTVDIFDRIVFPWFRKRQLGKQVEPKLPIVEENEKIANSNVETSVPLPTSEDPTLKNAILTVYEYTNSVLKDAISKEDQQILRHRLHYFANRMPIPLDMPQVHVDRGRVDYIDLCHYGWNVWNAFKDANNKFYGQSQLIEWLQSTFGLLVRYNPKTLRAKLRNTDKGDSRIHLVDNLKKYLQK